MRRGLLGGTFDPIHNGHLALAAAASRALELDELWFLPVGKPWMRPAAPIAGPEDRATMVSLAIEGHQCFRLSRAEIDREGETYTVDTLEEFNRTGVLDEEMVFIMGADAVAGLHLWKGPERILELVRIAVALRPGYDEIVAPSESQLELVFFAIDMPSVDISGTQLRRDISAGVSVHDRVPSPVADYIQRNGLYR